MLHQRLAHAVAALRGDIAVGSCEVPHGRAGPHPSLGRWGAQGHLCQGGRRMVLGEYLVVGTSVESQNPKSLRGLLATANDLVLGALRHARFQHAYELRDDAGLPEHRPIRRVVGRQEGHELGTERPDVWVLSIQRRGQSGDATSLHQLCLPLRGEVRRRRSHQAVVAGAEVPDQRLQVHCHVAVNGLCVKQPVDGLLQLNTKGCNWWEGRDCSQ
mmetsp:Transcript_30698/g.95416  ORF Transcript_30698/g.95416 Transcript_30698/m.95416 type:complete len:215 (+) Transcript_30698:399-1043(+)